jgi:hypothetical protein
MALLVRRRVATGQAPGGRWESPRNPHNPQNPIRLAPLAPNTDQRPRAPDTRGAAQSRGKGAMSPQPAQSSQVRVLCGLRGFVWRRAPIVADPAPRAMRGFCGEASAFRWAGMATYLGWSLRARAWLQRFVFGGVVRVQGLLEELPAHRRRQDSARVAVRPAVTLARCSHRAAAPRASPASHSCRAGRSRFAP